MAQINQELSASLESLRAQALVGSSPISSVRNFLTFYVILITKSSSNILMECDFCKVEKIEKELIVASNKNCVALMCLEPLEEGHLLIIPRRHIKELDDLTKEEVCDLIRLMTKSDKMLQKTYNVTTSFSYIKHGTAKTKEHFHVHLISGFVPVREALAAYKFSPKARDRKSLEELAVVANKIKSS